MTGDQFEHELFELTQFAFWVVQEAENEFNVPSDNLKHRFHELTQFAIYTGQEVETDFQGPVLHLKHLFLDLNQVAFWTGQAAEACPPLETSLSRSQPGRILDWSSGRN